MVCCVQEVVYCSHNSSDISWFVWVVLQEVAGMAVEEPVE